MGYLNDNLYPCLKHDKENNPLSYSALQQGLWYSSTSHAELQRTDLFDNTWLSKPSSDVYVALFLLRELQLSSVRFFKTQRKCYETVDSFGTEKMQSSFLYLSKRNEKESLFNKFWSGIRNSLAHGQFSSFRDYTYMLNQRSNEKEKVVFLLQTKKDFDYCILHTWRVFSEALDDENAFKYDCLKQFLSLEFVNGRYYSKKYERFIVIDNSFKFTANKHKAEIKKLISQYDTEVAADIIIHENIGNIKEKNRSSDNGLVRVIDPKKMIDCYQLSGVFFDT